MKKIVSFAVVAVLAAGTFVAGAVVAVGGGDGSDQAKVTRRIW